MILRRRGDSNPRYSFPYDSLANCWFQPLTHLSNSWYDLIFNAPGVNTGGVNPPSDRHNTALPVPAI